MNIDHENKPVDFTLFTKGDYPMQDGVLLLARQAPSFAKRMATIYQRVEQLSSGQFADISYEKSGVLVFSRTTEDYLNAAISLLRIAFDNGMEGVGISVADVRKFWFNKPFRSNILQWIREKQSNELRSDILLMKSFKIWATSAADHEWIKESIPHVVTNMVWFLEATQCYEAMAGDTRNSYDFIVDSWLVSEAPV